MRKKIGLLSILVVMIFTQIISASSYQEARGTYSGKGFKIRIGHADIYNIWRDRKTGKTKAKHWSKSNFRLTANKGYLVTKNARIIFNDKIYYFHGYSINKKGYFAVSKELSKPSHIDQVEIIIQLFNVKSSKLLTVYKKLALRKKIGIDKSNGWGNLEIKELN